MSSVRLSKESVQKIQLFSENLGLGGSGIQTIVNSIIESTPPLSLPEHPSSDAKNRRNCLFRVPHWLPDYIDQSRLPKQTRGAWLVKRVVEYFFQPKIKPDWKWNRRVVEVLGNKIVKQSVILTADTTLPGAYLHVSGNRITLLHRIQPVARVIGQTELNSKSLSATLTWLSIRHALKQEAPPQEIWERASLFTDSEKDRLILETDLLKGDRPSS